MAVGTLIQFDKSLSEPIEIVRATASNGYLEFALESISLGFLQAWQALPAPKFDPNIHLGVWTITIEYANGKITAADAVLLDHGITMPFVENIEAIELENGDLEVGWTSPDVSVFEDKCSKYTYRLRLLRDSDRQLYRSIAVPHIDGEAAYMRVIPADKVLAVGGYEDIWARVELQCGDSVAPGAESRSNAFAEVSGLLER